MNNFGVELFDLPWVQAVTAFFGWLGWTLFAVGIVVGAFECAIEYQGGRGSVKDTVLNYMKGFMAVSLFTVLPVNRAVDFEHNITIEKFEELDGERWIILND